MQFPTGATIVVTDGDTLRLLRNGGNELHLRLEELPAPALHTHHGAGHGPHANKANETPRGNAEDNHAAAVAAWLNAEAIGGRVSAVYVVAPPRTLGELRRHYHPALKSRLLGELNKEHARDPVDALHDVLVAA
jgi:protein required for attachment to host cells